MNLRRTLAIGTAGLAATLALTACGFSYPTDRINNITTGANDRTGTVNVLNAAIVSKQDDSGTFVATLVNNDQANPVVLNAMAGDGTTVSQVTVPAVSVPVAGLVNLATAGGIPMSGTFAAGQFVTLTLTFDDGEKSTLDVPVFADSPDSQWAGLDTSTPSSSPSP